MTTTVLRRETCIKENIFTRVKVTKIFWFGKCACQDENAFNLDVAVVF